MNFSFLFTKPRVSAFIKTQSPYSRPEARHYSQPNPIFANKFPDFRDHKCKILPFIHRNQLNNRVQLFERYHNIPWSGSILEFDPRGRTCRECLLTYTLIWYFWVRVPKFRDPLFQTFMLIFEESPSKKPSYRTPVLIDSRIKLLLLDELAKCVYQLH